MAAHTPWTWDELVEAFRALGGTIDNVRMGEGTFGRGLFPIDPKRAAQIIVPAQLLIDVADLVIDNDQLVLRPNASVAPDIRAFFERFQRDFSFGAGVAQDGRRMIRQQHALPAQVQEFMLASHAPGARRFPPLSDASLLRWFIGTRSAIFAAPGKTHRQVLMPVLELINHSSAHAPYANRVDGLEVAGRFDGELLMRYTSRDTWQTFVAWGFVSREPAAFSIGLDIGEPGGRTLRIRPGSVDRVGDDPASLPRIEDRDGILHLAHMLLGFAAEPGAPRWVFGRAMKRHGIKEPGELFDIIAHINRSWFYKLLELAEGETDGLAQLRAAARIQLETMSFSFGAQRPRAGAQMPTARPKAGARGRSRRART